MEEDIVEYDIFAQKARALFERKNRDYGKSWEAWRLTTFYDMLFSKIRRILQLSEISYQRQVEESIEDTLIDIINYCILALVKTRRIKKAEGDEVQDV